MSESSSEGRGGEQGSRRIEAAPNVFVHPEIVPGELYAYMFTAPDRKLETRKSQEGGSSVLWLEPLDDEERLRIIEGQRRGMTRHKEYLPESVHVIEFTIAEAAEIRKWLEE